MIAFELSPNVKIEQASPAKIVLYNEETKNKTAIKDKTDRDIISIFFSIKTIFIEHHAKHFEIPEGRIKKLLKKLEKRGFLIDVSEENTPLDDDI